MRRAGPGDAPAIAALIRSAYAKWVEVIGREPLPMTVDYTQALALHRFDVVERDGALAAVLETVADLGFLLIVNLAVDPARQGQGLGSELLGHAGRIAAQAGLAGLRLYTNRRFAENLRFYAARGFVVEREAPLNGGVAVFMTKTL